MTTERPILFSAPMVRALLAGTKTQTRRVVKPQPRQVGPQESRLPGLYRPGDFAWKDKGTATGCVTISCKPYGPDGWALENSHYGQPGDRLWVRETHMDLGACYLYRADHGAEVERALVAPGQRWKPAIHMPRATSRITLELTEVRVERLQDISEADAQAEGIAYSERFEGYCIGDAQHYNSYDPRQSYFSLWEAINGPGSVEANSWVWVVAFKVARA